MVPVSQTELSNQRESDFFLQYCTEQGFQTENTSEVMELLLTHGAPINAKRYDGETPLHQTVRHGHEDVAKLLRKHGATE